MFVAIDWSGRRGPDQRRALWLGAAREGALVRLEGGRTRAELVDLLIAEADRDPELVVGLDFAFSLPAWYLRQLRLAPRALWSALAEEALTPAMQRVGLAAWMNAPEPPFWTTAAGHAALGDREPFRRTELDVRAPGVQPKSVFQLVGAGQVGRGSLYGMQALQRLAAAGFHVWPFDPPARPLVVEIFPRLLTRAVVKSSRAARARYLTDVGLPPALHAHAEASEDAFDAAISALAMERGFGPLAEEPDYTLEGKIWTPDEVRSATRAMDFKRAKRFVDAVPQGRWTAYKDVAVVAGNPRGAQAVGNWIRREGHRMPTCYRVLTVDGQVPDAFRPAGAGLPRDAAHVREVLRAEGLRIDAAGFASKAQRFTADHWP